MDYIYLLSSFRHLDFKRFLNRIHIRQILNQRIQPAEVYFHLFFNRNKIYLDFFTKNKFVEACLKQAFIKFLLLQPLPPLKKLGMVINNKLIINKNHLKSLFASPSGSLFNPPNCRLNWFKFNPTSLQAIFYGNTAIIFINQVMRRL